MLTIATACMAVWLILRLSGFWRALATTVVATMSAYLLDALMHGSEMGVPFRSLSMDGTGLAHGIALASFLFAGLVYLVRDFGKIVAWLRRELRLS